MAMLNLDRSCSPYYYNSVSVSKLRTTYSLVYYRTAGWRHQVNGQLVKVFASCRSGRMMAAHDPASLRRSSLGPIRPVV